MPIPKCVQTSGRNDEAHAVKQRALAGRQFGSVRVSVEDGEEANQRRRNTQRRANFEHYGSTKKNRRESDSILDSRQRHSHQSKHSAESHHHGKRDRQNPNRRRAELRAPQTDRNHRQHVIESRDRMAKAGQESDGLAFLRVGKGRSEHTGTAETSSQRPPGKPARVGRSVVAAVHRAPPKSNRHSLHRPERAERANGVSGKGLRPSRPADFEYAEGTLQCQNQRDETELPEFYADVEADQCQWQFMPWAVRRWSVRWRSRSRAAVQRRTPPPRDGES